MLVAGDTRMNRPACLNPVFAAGVDVGQVVVPPCAERSGDPDLALSDPGAGIAGRSEGPRPTWPGPAARALGAQCAVGATRGFVDTALPSPRHFTGGGVAPFLAVLHNRPICRCAGDGGCRFAAVGVAVDLRGGSVIFDPLTAGFVGSAALANALVAGLGT